MKLIRDQSGISILESMVALGLVAMTGMAISSLMTTNAKSNRNVALTAEIADVTNLVRQNLGDEQKCKDTLQNIALDSALPSLLLYHNAPGTPDTQLVTNTKFRDLDVLGIRLKRIAKISDLNTVLGPRERWNSELQIDFRKSTNINGRQVSNYLGAPVTTQTIPIVVQTNPGGNNVLECEGNTVATQTQVIVHDQICSDVGGVKRADGSCDIFTPFCQSLGAAIDPVTGQCTFKQKICVEGGGTYDPLTNNCSYNIVACQALGGNWVGPDAFTGSCDVVQRLCTELGGVYRADGTCAPPRLLGQVCRTTNWAGNVGDPNDTPKWRGTQSSMCNNDEWVKSINVFQGVQHHAASPDEATIAIQAVCCKFPLDLAAQPPPGPPRAVPRPGPGIPPTRPRRP